MGGKIPVGMPPPPTISASPLQLLAAAAAWGFLFTFNHHVNDGRSDCDLLGDLDLVLVVGLECDLIVLAGHLWLEMGWEIFGKGVPLTAAAAPRCRRLAVIFLSGLFAGFLVWTG